MAGAVAAVLSQQGQVSGEPLDIISIILALVIVLTPVGIFSLVVSAHREGALSRNMLFLCITLSILGAIAAVAGMVSVMMVAFGGIIASVMRAEHRFKQKASENLE